MKKIIVTFLSLLPIISLSACNSSNVKTTEKIADTTDQIVGDIPTNENEALETMGDIPANENLDTEKIAATDNVVQEESTGGTTDTQKQQLASSNSETKEQEAPTESAERKENQISSSDTKINTDVFAIAEKVDVINTITTNKQVSLSVYISDTANQGLSFTQVLDQSYLFLQQDELQDAESVQITLIQGEQKIAQFTTQISKVTIDNAVPTTKLILNASKINMLNDEIKQFGEMMELW